MHNTINIIAVVVLIVAVISLVYVLTTKEHYEVPYWNTSGCCKCDKDTCPIEARNYQYCRCLTDYTKFI